MMMVHLGASLLALALALFGALVWARLRARRRLELEQLEAGHRLETALVVGFRRAERVQNARRSGALARGLRS